MVKDSKYVVANNVKMINNSSLMKLILNIKKWTNIKIH
jgi:hypothetical protein